VYVCMDTHFAAEHATCAYNVLHSLSVINHTQISYGHEIWARTFGAKLFLCFYFLFSTFVVGGIIGELSNYYIQMKEDMITDEIINDLTNVHQVDLGRQGKVNEAE
jgi:hypothetical protein